MLLHCLYHTVYLAPAFGAVIRKSILFLLLRAYERVVIHYCRLFELGFIFSLLNLFVNGVLHCMHIDCIGVCAIFYMCLYYYIIILTLLMGLEPSIE